MHVTKKKIAEKFVRRGGGKVVLQNTGCYVSAPVNVRAQDWKNTYLFFDRGEAVFAPRVTSDTLLKNRYLIFFFFTEKCFWRNWRNDGKFALTVKN